MRRLNPVKMGLVLAGLGAAWHVVRIVLVALGKAQPHVVGSLTFPETAAVILSGTVAAAFVLGFGFAHLWNRSAVAPRRVIWLAFILLVVAGAGIFAWNVVLRPVSVQVAKVESDVPVQVFGLGTVEARVQSKIGFKVSGVLAELDADVGDCVTKGSVLARLDSREQLAQVARARAAVAQGEANLQRAMASVEKAQVNAANTKNISQRRQTLAQSKIESAETAETAKAVADAAAADVGVANSDVAVAQAAIGDAQANVQLQSVTLDFHTLTAPYDAMVITRSKELGAALAANDPVFTIIDPTTVWVLAYVDESKAGEIAVGQPAEIVLRSQPSRRIAGHVARIEPESDRVNEERKVEVAFDRIPENFNLGEQAEVYITTVHLPKALLVAEAAITTIEKNTGTVWAVEAGHLQQDKVSLGHRLLDGRYEVTGGLPDGAAVVIQPRSGLRVGRAATIAKAQNQ